jgi:RNA polymerase sigma factor (sigma-70 family)
MDQVLLPYLNATDESERERQFDRLLLFHAEPLVRQIMRRRLGFNVSQGGTNRYNQDAEDLYQEIMTKIVQALHDLLTSSTRTEIENFQQYVARIAVNACNDFLRVKSRPRFLLKHKLRDLLSRHPDFAVWKYEGDIVCGFAIWQEKAGSPASPRQVRELENDLESFRVARFPEEDIHQVPLTRIVAELFQWVGCPIERGALATIVASLLGVRDLPNQSISDETNPLIEARLADTRFRADSALEARALLSRLWLVVKDLPPTQRDAFCLSFEDETGADLFSLLLEAELVTLPQLAKALDRSLEELVRLRRLVPMDSTSIAAELNASRSQVIKWRFRAVRRLKEELLG